MSKYNALGEFIQKDGKPNIQLSFNEIHDITGIEIDHSFLNYTSLQEIEKTAAHKRDNKKRFLTI